MPDPTVAAEALDAHPTLREGEPHFTLQGGDELSPPLVLLWAKGARALAETLPDDSLKQRNLLIRATAAEEMAWAMQAYQKGHEAQAEVEPTVGYNDAVFVIDVYSVRKALSTCCSASESNLLELVEKLQVFEHDEQETLFYASGFHDIENARQLLRRASVKFAIPRPPQ
jgi:hypothetical protein